MKRKINFPLLFGIHWGFHFGFWVILFSLLFLDYLPWAFAKDEEQGILILGLKLVEDKIKNPFALAFMSAIVNFVFAYIHLYIFAPILTVRKSNDLSWGKMLFYLIILITLGFANAYCFDFVAEKAYEWGGWLTKEQHDRINIFRNLPEAILSMICLTGVVVSLNWYNENLELVSANKALENQKKIYELEMELQGWRMEKHFMVNLFANLLVLVEMVDIEVFIEKVTALIDVMNYILYDCRESKDVQVNEEIRLLNNYITLRKVRYYGEELNIEVDLPETLSNTVKIVPLVLVEFLENAFKHGFDTFDSSQSAQRWVKVKLVVEEEELYYEVSNSRLPTSALKKHNNSKYGLDSIRKRLNNRYGAHYDLKIEATNQYYSVILKIDLTCQHSNA